MLIDTNMPGQEPTGTGHPDTDTAHKHTGSKHAKAMCLGNTFLSALMAVTGSLQHHNYNSPKEVQRCPTNYIKPKKDQDKDYRKESPPHMLDSTPACRKQNPQNLSKYKGLWAILGNSVRKQLCCYPLNQILPCAWREEK